MVIYASDFENTVPTDNCIDFRTRVWACGICAVGTEFPQIFPGISEMIDFLSQGISSIVYSHNLAYDGKLILDWLYTHGYTYSNAKRLKDKTFSHLISDKGRFYYIKIKVGKVLITFRDSLKILPFTLDKIAESLDIPRKLYGTIDYSKDRPEGYIPTDNEIEYLKRDLVILSQALSKISQYGLLDYLTIGKKCIETYKEMTKGKFEEWFPELPEEVDNFVRKSYKGGWCYVNEKFADRIVSNIRSYDVNSLYPFVQREFDYPYGNGIPYSGDFDSLLQMKDKAWFAKILIQFSVKENHFPFIQIKHDIYDADEKLKSVDSPVELTVTQMDLELIFEQYNIQYFEFIEAYVFEKRSGMFNRYIDKYFEMKKNNNDNPVLRLVAKLMLNNLGGQFGKSREASLKQSSYTDKIEFKNIESEKSVIYVPVASYMTSYARCITIRAAQANFNSFVYSDTDSLKLTEEPQGLKIHSIDLGAWKYEGTYDKARFVKCKTYIILKSSKYSVTAAGCSSSTANKICSMKNPLKSFTYGLSVPGELKSRIVPGGVILYPTQYTIS